jgi:hypothetical protein
MHKDECKASGTPLRMQRPTAPNGDDIWVRNYSSRVREIHWSRERKSDLRDIGKRIAEAAFGEGGLEYVRSRGRSRPQSHVRKEIADAAFRAGHSVRDIARFLMISDARVSTILAGGRQFKPVRGVFKAHIATM